MCLPDADFVTPGNHITQSAFVTATAGHFVTHRLVALIPGAPRVVDYPMFMSWRNLEIQNQFSIFDIVKENMGMLM